MGVLGNNGLFRVLGEALFWLRGGTLVVASLVWVLSWPVILYIPLRRWNAYIGWYGWSLNVVAVLVFAVVAAVPLFFAVQGHPALTVHAPAPQVP